jgi:hypothetical protein
MKGKILFWNKSPLSSHGNFAVFGKFSFPYYHGTLGALKISKMLKFLEIIFFKEFFYKGKYWMFKNILFIEMKIS